MTGKAISREQAIEQYALYKFRLYDYLRTFQVLIDIMDGCYVPKDEMGHGKEYYISTLKDSLTGLLVSMFDKDRRALNVFDVWAKLFPEKSIRIESVWKQIEQVEQILRDYRNKVSFHIEADLEQYLKTRGEFQTRKGEILVAMQAFNDLAKEVLLAEPTTLSEYRAELGTILRKEFPNAGKIEELLDYVTNARSTD